MVGMTREEDIKRLLLNVLRAGVLRIRAFAANEDTDRCLHEADHIHNLPDVIRNPRIELLTHYFDVSRPAFLKSASNIDVFEPDWLRLGELIAEMRAQPKEES
jgi:hypothetical protein